MLPRVNNDSLLILILVVIITGSFYLGSGKFFEKIISDNPDLTSVAVSTKCCDTGDGDACKPQTGENQTVDYKGEKYGLVKSKVAFVEGIIHLKDSGVKAGADPIILNSADEDNNVNQPTTDGYNKYCRKNNDDDTYFKKTPTERDRRRLLGGSSSNEEFIYLLTTYCTAVPNDELIFVCRENCQPASCAIQPTSHCYGSEKTVYDIYLKLSDYEKTGTPDFVKNCDKEGLSKLAPIGGKIEPTIIYESSGKKENLQLETFKLIGENAVVPWLSPFCKPAIYLYPEKETRVSVKVNPVGKFTYTDPLYPPTGWFVTAYPSGKIISGTKEFPYLYYEADIPSLLVKKPDEGFIIKDSELENSLNEILPSLGLNKSESDEMTAYWKKALPKSPYYFIGVIPETNLDIVAPLSISPTPDNIIRVALYFEPLEKKIEVKAPLFPAFNRAGFTVVEWGGIVKTDKPFTCFQ